MKRFLNAIIIGISYVIPGVCSSTTANSLGEYQNILEITGNFYRLRVLKKHINLIFGILIGGIISVIGLSLIVDNYICLLLSIFLGLNIGLFKFENFDLKNLLYSILGIVFVLLLTINFNISLNNNIFAYIVTGFVVALGFVLPGLSGSLLMLSMGVYQDILYRVSYLLQGQLKIDIEIILFVVFLAIGIIMWSKILFKLLKSNNIHFNSFIKGMSISGIALLAYETFYNAHKLWLILVLGILSILTIVFTRVIKKKI